jgi:hypothetical protein
MDFAKRRAEKKGQIKLDEARWECVPPGVHNAICIDVLSFKAQRRKKDDEIFETNVVFIVWLVYPKDQYGRPIFDSNGEPFKVDRQFNPTMAPGNKYGVRATLESWAGRELTIKEQNEYDLADLIGKPCDLDIETKQSAAGTVYPNVLAVSPCSNQSEFWVKCESYKPRDYTLQLQAPSPKNKSQNQAQEENAWRPEGKTKENDDIPF